MKYYKVLAKCGHVGGRRFYIPINFYICASSAKEAAKIVRGIPRVKHDQKDAILWVESISFEEYLRGVEEYNSDPYINCTNPFEQFFYNDVIMPRVLEEEEPYKPWVNKYRDKDIDAEERPNFKRAARFGHSDKMNAKYRESIFAVS